MHTHTLTNTHNTTQIYEPMRAMLIQTTTGRDAGCRRAEEDSWAGAWPISQTA